LQKRAPLTDLPLINLPYHQVMTRDAVRSL